MDGEQRESFLSVAAINSKLTMMATGIKAVLSTQLNMTTVLGKNEEILTDSFLK